MEDDDDAPLMAPRYASLGYVVDVDDGVETSFDSTDMRTFLPTQLDRAPPSPPEVTCM